MDLNDLQLFLKQNITYLLSYLGALQGFILAIIVLYYPREHKISNRILSVFIFILAYFLLIARIVELVDIPYLRLLYGIRFLAPMALLLYIKSLFHPLNWKKHYWHLLIILVDFIVLYILTTIKISTIGNEPLWNSFGLASVNWGWFILGYACYFRLIYRELRKYKFKVLRNFSTMNNLGLHWAYQLFFGLLIIVTIDVMVGSYSLFFPTSYSPYHGLVNTVAYTIFMYFVTIKGKLTPEIYKLRQIEKVPVHHETNLSPLKSPVIVEESHELLDLSRQVVKLIEEEKLYKEMGLSVNEIAEKLDSQTYLVSQAINSCLGKNFFELINRYRVEEAKTLLKDESMNYLSIVGIGYEAGFNSKTSFNTSFKKYTGMTPSEYKKRGAILPGTK